MLAGILITFSDISSLMYHGGMVFNDFSVLYSNGFDIMELFLMPSGPQCRVLSLLLSAVKIDRDDHKVSTSTKYFK